MSQGPRLQVEPFQTADSSQTSYAVINEESGAIAIDYSQYYERMATALETLATLSSTTGVKTLPAYSWLLAASMYKISVDDDGAIGLPALTEYHTKLNDNEHEILSGQISETECKEAIRTMKNNKSPGSDGISVEFYKLFWEDIKQFYLYSIILIIINII